MPLTSDIADRFNLLVDDSATAGDPIDALAELLIDLADSELDKAATGQVLQSLRLSPKNGEQNV